ncbi:MAG TPA: hypothetical protein PKL03_05240 [Candidatus Omnitrophota bacterium]|nr:hypothetical protein [Candidatus Omnitrophota bacterium]HNQ50823.1 hypothetical protein [Candidatus Omnitrophota bacterium]
MRRYWKQYLFVLIFAVLAHVLLYLKTGANVSTDFHVRYDPLARQLINWITGAQTISPGISGYQLFHMGYVLLVAGVYVFWGLGNLNALILVQMLFSVLSFVLVFHILSSRYFYRSVALIVTCGSLFFFDNIQWVTMAVPDSFFRAMFLVSFYILLGLYFNGRHALFLALFPVLFGILTLTRIDTVVLFIPLYFPFIRALIRTGRHWGIALLLGAAVLSFAFVLSAGKELLEILNGFYLDGTVFLGTDEQISGVSSIEAFDHSRHTDLLYCGARASRLFFLRCYQFLNVFPPFWSRVHQIYYALHVIPLYLLSLIALVRAAKTNDRYFIMFFYVFLLSMALQGLTFVDAGLRISYTALLFLIMFAGYGFDYAVKSIAHIRSKK